ncbi:Tn7-like element transposition protein TnsE [Acinetobacter johnsonii]|uniref:Tn7-like element transposition protein TnsE n=1 Tax=Acinetobacter johnsonii TaxID=40214 RepID=A0AA42U3F7_ACIJO|nr:Tn7-like element transposition protein TnsE [Acinetobacter johnsonii]MDH1436943.1 Tn7-like element transposition protein TnsE [Acinetobacter johnsonii]
MVKISHIAKNMKIKKIGSLFKKHNSGSWAINLVLENESKNTESTYTNFSNAKLLRKNSHINPTQEYPKGYNLRFKISSTQDWLSSVNNSNFPKGKFVEHYFLFDAVRVDQFGQPMSETIKIKLPQFELARSLFLYTPYLARSAVLENSLSIDFDIISNRDHYLINILPACSYPISHFNDSGIRRILSWILLDPDIRQSFESISRFCTKYGYDVDQYRIWSFCFNPPQLNGVIFDTYGYYRAETSEFFVNEISGFERISSCISKEVEFYSDKFIESKSGGKGENSSGTKNYGKESTIKDEEDGNNDDVQIIDVVPTHFDFLEAIETRKTSKKTRHRNHGTKDQDLPSNNATPQVSTNEPISEGTIPSAEFNGVEDETEDLHLYLDRFSAFQQMIDLFCKENSVKNFSFQLHKLPNIQGHSKHIKTDGNPRCVAEVSFQFNSHNIVILEVDTSDNKKPLSTRVLSLKDMNQWNQADRAKVLELVVTQCLRWPKGIFKKICFKNSTLNHPRMNSKKQEISESELNNWANRLTLIIATI